MAKVVDIRPDTAEARAIIREYFDDPYNFYFRRAVTFRTEAERLRACGEAPQHVLDDLANDADRIADKLFKAAEEVENGDD